MHKIFDVVTEATLRDVDEIVDLVNAAYRGKGGVVGWTSEIDLVEGDRATRTELIDLIDRQHSVVLCAKQGERLVACVHLEHKNELSYLGMLSVDPEFQGQGLGSSILTYAEDYCRSRFQSNGIKMCVVAQRTELVGYYLSRGYEHLGDEDEYPSHLNVGIPKRDGLTIQYLGKYF